MNKKLFTILFLLTFTCSAWAELIMPANQQIQGKRITDTLEPMGVTGNGDTVAASPLYDLEPGFYLPQNAYEAIMCPANSTFYCPGGNVSYSASSVGGTKNCASGYKIFDYGASAVECYKTCPTIPYATGVTGYDYADGDFNTCIPTGCNGGYSNRSVNAQAIIEGITTSKPYVFNRLDNGTRVFRSTPSIQTEPEGNNKFTGTTPGEWAVYYDVTKFPVRGLSACSTQTATVLPYGTNLTQNDDGGSCYCKVTAVEGTNATIFKSRWVYFADYHTSCRGACAEHCAGAVASGDIVQPSTNTTQGLMKTVSLQRLAKNVSSVGNSCANGIYPVILSTNNGKFSDNSTSKTVYEKYATGWALQDTAQNFTQNSVTGLTAPTRTGFTFVGFYDANLPDITESDAISGNQKVTSNLVFPNPNSAYDNTPTWYARWVRDCAPNTGATCSRTIQGSSVTYAVGCSTAGYVPDCTLGCYNPQCGGKKKTVTLDSRFYSTASDTTGIATTASNPSTLYFQYGAGWNTSSIHDPMNSSVTLTSIPVNVYNNGTYIFTGFYTNKFTGGTQVINASGTTISNNFTTDTSDTATLYARWSNCSCTKGTGVASCVAKNVANNTNNKCQYTVTYNVTNTKAYAGPATQTNQTAGQPSYTASATECTNLPTGHAIYTGSGTSATNCLWQCETGWKTANGDTSGTTTGQACSTGVQYTITYEMDGGKCASTPATTYTHGTTYTLCQPTKIGFKFKGWTGDGITSPQTSYTIPATATGNKTYTATWEGNKITIVWLGVGEAGANFEPLEPGDPGYVAGDTHRYKLEIDYGSDIMTPAGYNSNLGTTFVGWRFINPNNL